MVKGVYVPTIFLSSLRCCGVFLDPFIIENTFLPDSYASEDSDVLDSAAVTLRAVMITAANTL